MKYINTFDSSAAMKEYAQTLGENKHFLFRDENGHIGVGTSLNSGNRIVTSKTPRTPVANYLCFTALEANSTVKMGTAHHSSGSYSVDGGYTWENALGVTVTLASGDQVWYKGVAKNCTGLTSPMFSLTGKLAVSGSNMSMNNEDPDDTGGFLGTHLFTGMFYNQTALVDASGLDIAEAGNQTQYFQNMFYGCSNLEKGPLVLPRGGVNGDGYNAMFRGCSKLTKAPEIMVTGSIVGKTHCFYRMFYGCSMLNKVTIHVTEWDTSAASDWLRGVASTGTIHNLGGATIPTNSTSGCPSGWTIVNN